MGSGKKKQLRRRLLDMDREITDFRHLELGDGLSLRQGAICTLHCGDKDDHSWEEVRSVRVAFYHDADYENREPGSEAPPPRRVVDFESYDLPLEREELFHCSLRVDQIWKLFCHIADPAEGYVPYLLEQVLLRHATLKIRPIFKKEQPEVLKKLRFVLALPHRDGGEREVLEITKSYVDFEELIAFNPRKKGKKRSPR